MDLCFAVDEKFDPVFEMNPYKLYVSTLVKKKHNIPLLRCSSDISGHKTSIHNYEFFGWSPSSL